MKVTIACLNSKYIHAATTPWCLAAGVRAFAKGQYEVQVAESTVNADTVAFIDELLAFRPQVVALSCYIWNITKVLTIAEALKSAGCTIVLGGPEVAYRAEQILRDHPFVDYVLSGEGEFVFPAFLDMLFFGTPPVAGLTLREAGKICSLPEEVYTQTPPSPYSDEYFAALRGRICYIESSRGCPYRCAFCLSGRVSPLRFFDLEQIKTDLLRLAQSGTQTIKFVDRTFNANRKHADEILSFIAEHYGKEIPVGVCFHFEIAGDILKESTFAILAKMPVGAVQLEIGLQSFNPETLAAVNRKTNIHQLTKNIRRLLSFNNMHIHIDLIAGMTGEDLTSFAKSFDIAYRLNAHMLQLGFLKLLHGADMRENKEKYPCSFTEEPPYEVTQTPWLSPTDIARLKVCENAVDKLYNSGRFLLTLSLLEKELMLSPFALFETLGRVIVNAENSPGRHAVAIYEHFAPLCNAELLRETLLRDLLCCGAAKQIYPPLKVPDPRHKTAKRLLAGDGQKKLAVLPVSGCVFVVDQCGKKDLRGRLAAQEFPLEILYKK